MLDSKTLNTLDSMAKYKTYSKYNTVLEKKFKGYSLKSLIYTCKNPRQFVKVKFLEEFVKKHPYENEQYNDNIMLNAKTRNFFNSLDKKPPKINVIDAWARKSSFNKLYEPAPDPFRYNPNYNSIFKNVPSCIIAPPRVHLLKNIKKNKNKKKYNLIPKKKKVNKKMSKTFDELVAEINNSSEKSRNIEDNENEKITKTLPALKKRNYFLKSYDKNNHAYKFSDYPPRKSKKIETNDKISYIEPHDYKNFDHKKVIDFSKMEDRDKRSILINYASLGVPSSSYYNPKYEYTDHRPAQTLFTHQNIVERNKKSNKYSIHKLWTCFNVGLQYKLIDNDKLNNDLKDINL